MKLRFTGFISATFTPMHEDGSIWLERIEPMVEYLHRLGIDVLYVVGSTGEGISLTVAERRAVAEAFIKAARGKIPVMVHVGHTSLQESRELAAHAQSVGADAVSALPPFYFKPSSLSSLVDCMHEVCSGAPDLPFYYYHIPGLTNVSLDAVEFIEMARDRLPNFAGIKYTAPTAHEYQACVQAAGDDLDILWGVDEMLLCGLSMGAKAAVGSTYGYSLPLYRRILDAFNRGDLAEALLWQRRVIEMVRRILPVGGMAAQKAVMKLIGQDCGPARLPLIPLKPDDIKRMGAQLREIGYFDWMRQ